MIDTCAIPSFETLSSLVSNRKAIYKMPVNPSREDTIAALKHTAEYFKLSSVNVTPEDDADDKRRYTLINPSGTATDVFLRWRVTSKTSRQFKRGKTPGEIKISRESPDNVLRRDYGTQVHDLLYRISRNFKQQRDGATPSEDLAALKTYAANHEYPVSPKQFDNLVSGVQEIFKEIDRIQKSIDPQGKAEIFLEHIVVDPVKDVGGTMDVLAVFSDNSGMLYDYKTMTQLDAVSTAKGRDVATRGYVTEAKREAWKLQMSTYKDVLLKRYGVNHIRGTRIVPVWLDVKAQYTGKKRKLLKSLSNLKLTRQQSENLKHVLATYETTNIGFIDDFLTSNYREMERLRRELLRASREEKERIRVRLRALEDAIQEFVEVEDVRFLVRDAASVSLSMQAAINTGKATLDEINRAIDYMSSVVTLQAELAKNVHQLSESGSATLAAKLQVAFRELDTPKPETGSFMGQIRGGLSYLIHYRDALILTEAGVEYDPKQRVTVEEQGFMSQIFLPGTQQTNPITALAMRKVQESREKTRQDVRRVDAKLDTAEEGLMRYLKSNGINPSDAYKFFINPRTGDFFSMMSSEFYTARAEARDERNLEFFTTNYRLRKTNRHGQTYAEWFKETKEYMTKLISTRYAYLKEKGEKAYETQVDREINAWEKRNNLAVNSLGEPLYPDAWLTTNSGWLEVTEEAKQRYGSDEWKKIQSIPELKTYMDTVSELIYEWRDIIGDGVGSNFFPKVRAEWLEKLSRSEGGAILQDMRELFDIRQDEQDFGMHDPLTMEADKVIPLFFTNPFRDKDGKVDLSQQSLDLGRSIRLFSKVVYNYKHMQEIEAIAIASKQVLATKISYSKRDDFGNKFLDFMGNWTGKEKATEGNLTEKVFNTLIDYHVYGIRLQTSFGSKRATKIVRDAMNYFSLKTLGLGFVAAGASYAAAKAMAWTEGKKGLLYNSDQWKEGYKLQATDHKKYHAIGYFFGVHNDDMLEDIVASRGGAVSAVLSNKLYTSKIQQYINERSLLRPFSYGDERLDNHITVAMAQNYGVGKDGQVRRLQNLPKGSSSLYDLLEYKDGVMSIKGLDEETTIKVITQFKLAVRAGQMGIKGAMTQDDIAYSQTDLFLRLMMQFKSWMPGVVSERFGGIRYNEILDAPQWGRYRALWSEKDVAEAATTAHYIFASLYRSLGFLLKAMLTYNSLARLAGGNITLNDERNKMLYEKFKHEGLNTKDFSYEQFMEFKRGQIRAVVSEIEVLMIFATLLMMFGADWDEDGKPLWRETWGGHQLYKVLNRVVTEVSWFYNPSEYAKIVRSPIPIVSMVSDAFKLVGNTTDEIGDVLLGEDTRRFMVPFGKNTIPDNHERFHYVTSFIPGGYQLRRFFDLTELDQKAQR